MRTSKPPHGLLFALLLGAGFVLQACSGAWLQVQHVPEDGYHRTLNYQFQAQVHVDDAGECQMMVVRVKPLNKVYTGGEPPPRLQIFDDDCMRPVRFERVQFVSRESGEQIRLHGSELVRFWSDNVKLEDELVGWLWRSGVI